MSFAKQDMQEGRFLKKGLKNSLKCKSDRILDHIQKSMQPSESDANIFLVKGDVLVTKNPCGHPGDIRLAKAIDETHPAFKKLKHLANVIVFPS